MASGMLSLEHRVLSYLTQAHDGAAMEEIKGVMQEGETVEMVVAGINDLLAARQIMMLRTNAGELRYKAAGAREQRTKGLNAEEVMVFQQIQKAGNSGVWTKDLKIRTNLAQPQITKILKALEARGLTKSVKSVANPSRKLVMLAELEPSKEVTGGAWYTQSQQFDSEFIAVVRDALLRYIERVGEATLSGVTRWITDSGLVKNVNLGPDDVQQVLDSLVWEGQVDELDPTASNPEPVFRRAVDKFPPTTALTSLPCGRCPVIDQCRDGGPISPATCEYFQRWLDF
ncbi:MAG: RNA polymerase Rpc34 [Monoraphidium minutum]|nr:MAG: RNA polymerase Rpc34 [Monoraphidium minutum]